MKTRRYSWSAVILSLLVPVIGLASSSASDQRNAGVKVAAATANDPVSALKRAMPADEVRGIMGRPDEIKPMASPNGKAEIWVYHRKINERTELLQTGGGPVTTTVYGPDGRPYVQTTGEEPRYTLVHYATEETIELLMFNDHFLTAKISRRETSRID